MTAKTSRLMIIFMILSITGFMMSVSDADSFEFSHGAALRQNVLVFKRPTGSELLIPERSFGISQSALRIYEHIDSGNFAFSTEIETRMSFSSSTGFSAMFGEGGGIFGSSRPLEHWDVTIDHISDSSTEMTTRLERLDLRWSYGSYDINIGRQPLSLGTSHFIGVLDVVAPFAPGDLDATYKPGVDALRLRRGVGMTGEAELIMVGSKPWSNGAILGRYRSSIKGIDIELVGGRFRHRGFGGIGWEGGVGDFGIWGETALFERRKDVENVWGGWKEAAFSIVAGIDVNLPIDFKGGGALMYQDFGVRKPEDLAIVSQDAPFQEGWAFLASAGYGLVTLHRQLYPLVDADIAGIINLVDGSTLWQPRLTVNVGDNTDMTFYGWFGAGEKNSYSFDGIRIRSEFGSIPDGGGFYARWFF
ncbi:hypothetical protein ACFL60_01595 [Candidatus Omnitrophota bacterium]